MGSSAIALRQQSPTVNTQQASYTNPTLLPPMNPTLSQTAETPVTVEIWKMPLEQLNKVNQDNKLLKKDI